MSFVTRAAVTSHYSNVADNYRASVGGPSTGKNDEWSGGAVAVMFTVAVALMALLTGHGAIVGAVALFAGKVALVVVPLAIVGVIAYAFIEEISYARRARNENSDM